VIEKIDDSKLYVTKKLKVQKITVVKLELRLQKLLNINFEIEILTK